MKIAPGLSIGRTFQWFGLSDVAVYRSWLLARLAEERPRRVLVSHGEPIEGPDLEARLRPLIEERLR